MSLKRPAAGGESCLQDSFLQEAMSVNSNREITVLTAVKEKGLPSGKIPL